MVATKDGIYDPSAKWVDLGNGQYVQQLAKLDLDLVAYIRASTSNYTWAAFPVAPDHDWNKTPNVSDEVRDRLSGRVLDTQGGFRSSVLVDGEAFNPRFLPCGDASCVASGAGIDLKDPETQRWISAGNTKAAKDALAVGSLAPLPMAWIGKVLGSVFGKGVASEAIGGGSSAVVAKGLGNAAGEAKGVGNATLYADDICFSQNTVSFNKMDRISGTNYTYDDLVQSMKTNGWKGDPVDVVKMPDGKLTSMDNTRIAAAREAGIDVNASVRGFDDPLTSAIQEARGWQSFDTWGEAITGRINKQSGGFSTSNPYGSTEPPRISGGGK
ncbi:hypothetical protein SAMN04490185_2537 [Pseudomonas frederiksbergensis]|uniref:Filamentous hemagglutinin n=1 Tax=Pseudomonas frederiksbergensis TaxID=104087 RepID=A0A1H4X4I9_9PSED|nr:hypothetical protein [Pseudomonas frederiksbergensis]SED00150.1 hypothetical protein SAMN04490185_2537 [Pseudomonas frederiksbergensis]